MAKKRPKTEEEKAAQRAASAERKAARLRAEKEAAQELLRKRKEQLVVATAAVNDIHARSGEIRRREASRSALQDHATGFYEEVDKLARGKALMEVTNLVVAEANEIIRDCKALIQGDPFLDRVKEFVPAGTNPVYPDVVVTLKTVLQVLGRAEPEFEAVEGRLESLSNEAETIHAALKFFVEERASPSRDEIRKIIGDGNVVDEWFRGS